MTPLPPCLWHEPRAPWVEVLGDGRAARLRFETGPEVTGLAVEYGDRYRYDLTRRTLELVGSAGGRRLWQGVVDMPTRRLRYRVLFGLRGGRPRRTQTVWGDDGDLPPDLRREFYQFPYAYPSQAANPWAGATVYALFPDRFARTPGAPDQPLRDLRDVYGGTIAGIRSHLDYLEDLGVGVVYLNPIHPAGSYHRYDVEDYRAVDARLGSLDEFRALARDVHERGMRLVLDMVFNHTSWRHPWFIEASRDPSSPMRGRYRFRPDGSYETFGDNVASLPKVVWTPEVEREVADVLAYWRDLGADGFRLDVGNEMPRADWVRIRERLPDVPLWGEVFPPAAEWVEDGPYTGVLDYVWLSSVGVSTLWGRPAERLASAVMRHEMLYTTRQHGANWVPLGSHDLPRPMTVAGGRRARVVRAQVLLWASPGLPVLYYGDEQYMQGGADPDCRRPMPWDEVARRPQQALWRQLAHWRRAHPWVADLPLRHVAVHGTTVAIERGQPPGPRLLTLVATAGAGDAVPLPRGRWRDAMGGERVAGAVRPGEMGARILVSAPAHAAVSGPGQSTT